MTTTKTPEQIAEEALPVYIGDSDTSDGFDRDDMRTFAVAAIEADRAQHVLDERRINYAIEVELNAVDMEWFSTHADDPESLREALDSFALSMFHRYTGEGEEEGS